MGDRGFTVIESLGLRLPKLVIPAFTRGKPQLDPVDVEETRGIENVRIYVKRVIGLLRQKYTTYEGSLLTDFLISRLGDDIFTMKVQRKPDGLVWEAWHPLACYNTNEAYW